MPTSRTPVRKKAQQISKLLKKESPDYNYLRELFRHIRQELNIHVDKRSKSLPYVPTEEEIKKYYRTVWGSKNMKHVIMIKLLLYTGARVSEIINIKINHIDLENCQIKIVKGKGNKDRIVPFPENFSEPLAIFIESLRNTKSEYLFESNWKKPYSDRSVRKIMEKYSKEAGLKQNLSPHKLRHFLFTWMKKQGVDDALIQPYSGHEGRASLEIYSKLSLSDSQKEYENQIKNFPI